MPLVRRLRFRIRHSLHFSMESHHTAAGAGNAVRDANMQARMGGSAAVAQMNNMQNTVSGAGAASLPSPTRITLARPPHAATNQPTAAMAFQAAATAPVHPAASGPSFMSAEQAAEGSLIRSNGVNANVEMTAVAKPPAAPTHTMPFTPFTPSALQLDGQPAAPPLVVSPYSWGAAAHANAQQPTATAAAVRAPRTHTHTTTTTVSTVTVTQARHSPSGVQHHKQRTSTSPNGMHNAAIRSLMVNDPSNQVPSIAASVRVPNPNSTVIAGGNSLQAQQDPSFAGTAALASAFGLSPPQPAQTLAQRYTPVYALSDASAAAAAASSAAAAAASTAAVAAPQPLQLFSPPAGYNLPPRYPAGHVSFNVAPSSNGSQLSVFSGGGANGLDNQTNMAMMQKHMQQAMRQQQRQQPAVAEEQAPDLNYETVIHSEMNPLSAYVETNSRVGDLHMYDHEQQPVPQQARSVPLPTALAQAGPADSASPITPLTVQQPVATATDPRQPQPNGFAVPAAATSVRVPALSAQPAQSFQSKRASQPAGQSPLHVPAAGGDGPIPGSPGRSHWIPQQHPRMQDLVLRTSDNHCINEYLGPNGERVAGSPAPTFELESNESRGLDGKRKRKVTQVPALSPQQHVIQVDATQDEDNSFLDDAPETDEFIAGADQDVLIQQRNGGPAGRRRAVPQASPAQQGPQPDGPVTGAAVTAGGPAATDKSSAVQSNFSSNLRFFKYLLLLGGLRQQTSSFYRWYIRITVWGCTLMCFANIFLQTKSFRNPFFDVTLVVMHFWVSYSFEKWHVFTKSHHWRLLVSIVSQSKTGNFFVHINQVGVFGLIATAGATVMVCLGWIGPIVYESWVRYQNSGRYAFLMLHGVFMTLIILPWAAACICSSVLFHMVVLAHQSDVEHYFQTVKSLLITFADSQGSEALEETYGWLVRLLDDFPNQLTLTVRSSTTVADIMAVIFQKTGVPPSTQRLQFAGKELVPHCQIGEYMLGPGSTIQLLLRLLGGGGSGENLANNDRARNLHAYLCRLLSRRNAKGQPTGRCVHCGHSASKIHYLDADTVLNGRNTLAGVMGGRRKQNDFSSVSCQYYQSLLVELERNIGANGAVLLQSMCGPCHARESARLHKLARPSKLTSAIINRKMEIGICQSLGASCGNARSKCTVTRSTAASFHFVHLHPAVEGGHCAACIADPRLVKFADVDEIQDSRALAWELSAPVTRMLCEECYVDRSLPFSHPSQQPISARLLEALSLSPPSTVPSVAAECKEADEALDAMEDEIQEREDAAIKQLEQENDAIKCCLLPSCGKLLPDVKGRVCCSEVCRKQDLVSNPADPYAMVWLERVLLGTHEAQSVPDRTTSEAHRLGVIDSAAPIRVVNRQLAVPPPPPLPPSVPAPPDDDEFQIFISLQQPRSRRLRTVMQWDHMFGEIVRYHQPVRMRLRMTCHYFNSLYALAIFVSIMLICASIADFNDLIVRQNPVWHFIVQDAFFMGLGIVAMYGSLWVTSNLTNYWLRFVQRINELPQFLLTHPAAHNGLVNYFKTADVAYTVFGAAVTPAFIRTIIGTAAQIMFIALIIYNWRYLPQQNGSLVLPPADPPGPSNLHD